MQRVFVNGWNLMTVHEEIAIVCSASWLPGIGRALSDLSTVVSKVSEGLGQDQRLTLTLDCKGFRNVAYNLKKKDITMEGSLLDDLHLPVEPTLGTAKTDVSLKSMDVQERHITNRKCPNFGGKS
ncbi:hypothetical protein J6590_048775 [Homalodisca vitripennis]|nr:hypothetical protein J6590_048775 [Homalodisca vitripennis]